MAGGRGRSNLKGGGHAGVTMFRCEAVYRGCRAVLGAQSSTTLTLLIDHLLAGGGSGGVGMQATPHAHESNNHTFTKLRSERCQLQCDDERLQVTPIRRDEGFESDSESSSSTCDESFCGNQDIKVISDHVLRLDHLIHHDAATSATPTFTSSMSSSSASDDASSSATSSGNESEDEIPRTTSECLGGSAQNGHSQVEGGNTTPGNEGIGGGGVMGGGGGGGVSVPGDTFLMSDILYCHVAPATPRVVVVVVKDAGSSQVYAHVFQCVTDEAAKALYAHYKEASNKYKLNRYRNSKRRADQNTPDGISASTGTGATVYKSSGGGIGAKDGSHGKPPIGGSSSMSKASGSAHRFIDSGGGGRGSLRSIDARLLKAERRNENITNNVNVIEIKESPHELNGVSSNISSYEDPRPWNLVQHTDANGVTHIEIESGPCSLLSSSSEISSDFNSLASNNSQQLCHQNKMNSLSAIPTPKADLLEGSSSSLQGSNSCPTSLINPEREILVAGEVDKKSRQREPPQYLRGLGYPPSLDQPKKFDDKWNEEKTRKNEKGKKDDRRRDDKKNREEREGRSRRGRHEVDLRSNNTRDVVMPQGPMESLLPRVTQERQSRQREQSRNRLRNSHNKGPAPPPPPRRHPNNPSLLLVPTKSGAENARAFYPKESHIIRGNKIVRIEYPSYSNSGWRHHDVNNNPHHYNYMNHGVGAWVGAHEYHAVRTPRESTISNEMRRRSRSKSPARRPMAHRYIDAVSTFNLSQKLKDISEAVFTSKRGGGSGGQNGGGSLIGGIQGTGISSSASSFGSGRENRGHSRSQSSVSASMVEGASDGTLKSVIKKGRKAEPSPQTRRVTFSAYATVQVMEA